MVTITEPHPHRARRLECGDSDGEDEAKGRAELKLKGGERQMEIGGRGEGDRLIISDTE